ncbi:MAG: WbqC family protein [Alphaproteobacteria bacterium]|nr:WbqC family protein [Alphaproteobacteria bacterium]
MIVSINQPAYLPWLGYFHRIAASDQHIVFDHVQFEKNSFINRNKVRTAQGWAWLTVPVETRGHFGDLAIRELPVDNRGKWRKKHRKTLLQAYAHAPYLAQHRDFIDQVYDRGWDGLNDLLRFTAAYFLDALAIETPLSFSHDMASQGAKDELVLDLCRKAGASVYLSGALGRGYLREEIFRDAGIEVIYQDYAHPQYQQCQQGPFEPFMSVLDLLLNHGPHSREILLSGQAPVTASLSQTSNS